MAGFLADGRIEKGAFIQFSENGQYGDLEGAPLGKREIYENGIFRIPERKYWLVALGIAFIAIGLIGVILSVAVAFGVITFSESYLGLIIVTLCGSIGGIMSIIGGVNIWKMFSREK